jgi:hypothetical protein
MTMTVIYGYFLEGGPPYVETGGRNEVSKVTMFLADIL